MKRLILAIALIAAPALSHAVEKDKKLHFGVSAVISSSAYLYTESYTKSAMACMAVGVAKELYDEHKYGGFDTRDLAADALGCAAGLLLTGYVIKPIIDDDFFGVKISGKF